MKYHSLWLFVIFLCACYNNQFVQSTHDEDSWIEPDAWRREEYLQNPQQSKNKYQSDESWEDSKCPVCKNDNHSEEDVALMYYKRLIAYLFNSDFFKQDDLTGEFTRSLILTALPAQLEQLKNLNDPRDLDMILSKILLNTRVPIQMQANGKSVFALIWEIIKDLGQLLKISEVQFLLGAAGLLLIGWHCHRKYSIGIIAMIVGAVVCFGYFHTYLECNRKLEAERLLEMLARHEQLAAQEPRWYTPIVNFFTFSEQQAQKTKKEYIKQASQLNLNFCRPDHVFLLYANDLFLKQLTFLIDKSIETMETLRNTLSFPFNYIAGGMLVFLIGYIVKLTFKYILSPRAWYGVWQQHEYATHRGGLPASTGTALHEDRISGENLRILLNAISGATSSNQISISNTTATASLTQAIEQGSGVQEILASLENGSADTASDSSMSEKLAKSKENSPQKQTDETVNNNATAKQQDVSKSDEKAHEK
ncbi:PREDICTED: uncharacterized protein LOC108974153 isoform X2 [Bactrocera latifrons]|uniref:uncharacterized protein LOC108974153 isoform X2 n=1 Tax=Bactrocera latifrons TaxID=174628 RepID=UPI0008DE750F|nr:PREDICTED: uncharacterized protein LOC108974153 isoform X2 [Bactrocera latifrons]